MKRTLRDGEAIVRLNDMYYRGSIARALINHGPSRLQAVKVVFEVDSVATIDDSGNVSAVSNDGHGWDVFSDAHDPWIDMDDGI